jgi:hypothetical protein
MLWLDPPTSLFLLSQTSSEIRFGDRNPALSRTDIADCSLRNEYLAWLIISQLEQVVTQWNSISWFIAQLFTHQSVYSYISNCSWNYKPSGVCWKRVIPSSISYGKIMTSQGSHQLSIFIQCGRLCILFIFLFKPSHSVMDQKLKWNVRLALYPTSYMHFILYRQSVLSPFLYKISCDHTHQVRECVCFG